MSPSNFTPSTIGHWGNAPVEQVKRPNVERQRILAWLALNGPASIAAVHWGAGVAGPGWTQHKTGSALSSMVHYGYVAKIAGGLFKTTQKAKP